MYLSQGNFLSYFYKQAAYVYFVNGRSNRNCKMLIDQFFHI